MEQKKNSRNAIRLPIFIALAISLGVFIGANMADNTSTSVVNGGFKNILKFRQVLSYIENDYVDEVSADKLVESAITEMLSELDPHSVYIPKEDLEITNSQLEGNFEGIGVEFTIYHDTIQVVSALSGGPSESLGIRSGDKIISVDSTTVAGVNITNREVMTLLRGKKGSEVKIMIKRRGVDELLEFNVERDVIPQFSVDASYMINKETGYIKINRFSATTYTEFKQSLNELQENGMQSLVLDLTGNPGGYMSPAVKLVDELLEDNEMIVYTKGKDSRHNDEYWSKEKGAFERGAIIVLIDEGSASASEIVTGALQDHDRALVVGRRSYGKGLVQMPIELNDGSAMRLTISRYYTPSGRCIQKPYSGDKDEYYKEYYERFENGEIYSKDSIKVNDTLVFHTDKGRIVYGGGGIIPDYFVPLDTAGSTMYLTRLFNSYTIQEYALNYYDDHKAELDKWDQKDYIRDFKVSDAQLNQVVEKGKTNGIKFNQAEFETSKASLRNFVKAYIAKSIWGMKGFYPVYNQQNEILNKALTLFEEADKLASKD